MKRIAILIWVVVFTLCGCDKQLEIKSKDSVDTKESLSNMTGIKSALVGMYASMRNAGYYGRSMYVYGDLSGTDVYLAKANSNRYLSTFQKNYASNDADMTSLWTAIYTTIANANNIINAVDGVQASQAEKDQAKGEALFIRSLGYFDLVRVFAKPYAQGNGSQLGVPLVLVSDVNNFPSRNTVTAVYDRVINDLKAAKTLMAGSTSAQKLTANQFAAAALLSRVYLYKGDNLNAVAEADFVKANTAFQVTPAVSLADFYGTPGNPEEIFTLKITDIESLGSDNIGAMYLKPGYGDIRVSPDLVNTFDKVNDVRYQLFISAFTGSASEFQNNKFSGQDNINFLHSPKILRYSEVLLNRAEALAKIGGRDQEALADLNAIRTRRGLGLVAALSGQPLVDAILMERRHELMFEGHQFFDLIRNGRPRERNFCNSPLEITVTQCTLTATDPKVVAPIPQAEMSANPSLAGQQNEGY